MASALGEANVHDDATDETADMAAALEEQEKRFRELALSEPTIVGFYLPLLWPIAVPPIGRFTMMRNEDNPWGLSVKWLPFFGLMNKEENFVLISLHRHDHTDTFDGRFLDYAMAIADAVLPPEEPQAGGTNGEGSPSDDDAPAADGLQDTEIKTEPALQVGRVPLPSSDTPATVVELMTPLLESGPDIDPVSLAFNRCIEELNIVENAYIQTSNDLRTRVTTRNNCFPTIPFVFRRVESGDVVFRGIYMINYGLHLLPYAVDDLTPSQVQDMAVRISLIKKRQPLSTYIERNFTAHRAVRYDGDYSASVMWTHTAGEVFFDTILSMLAWEEINYDPATTTTLADVATWFSYKASLAGRIERHYHTRLFGGWNPALAGTALYRWTNDVSRLRNRVVHAGYRPTEAEANHALDVMAEVENFVKDILCHHRNLPRFPRTALMLLGEPGLKKRNKFSKGLKRVIDNADTDWHRSFAKFRDQVNALLQ